MKTYLTSILYFLMFAATFAQSEKSTHIKFKKVPIDGTLNEYVTKMKKSGFTLIKTEDSVAMLKGDFAGYKDCIIGVSTLKGQDLVSKIIVLFPKKNTWSSISSNYYNLKGLLTEKYGKPIKSIEKWDSFSEPSDDADRIFELKKDNCKYYTTYKTKYGSIQLSIDHESVYSCYVSLIYSDKINSDKIREKALDDL